jgi:N-acetylmuramoyl-L-alanine amidase
MNRLWGIISVVVWLGAATAVRSEPAVLKAHRIGGNSYIMMGDVARYYGLGRNVSRDDDRLEYRTKFAQLSVQAERREINVNGVQHWLSAPVLSARGQWWVTAVDLLKAIDPVLRQGKSKDKSPARTVVLDPGHGGTDRGARGRKGIEKELTLDVAKRVGRELEAAGLKVVFTRSKDTTLALQDRADTAADRKGDLFVSIHFNSGGSADGIETYCLPPAGAVSTANPFRRFFFGGGDERVAANQFDEKNVWLGHCVQKALIDETSATDRGVRRARFFVLREAPCPAILVEGGFLTNRAEEQKLLTIDYKERLSKSIAAGILEYRKAIE